MIFTQDVIDIVLQSYSNTSDVQHHKVCLNGTHHKRAVSSLIIADIALDIVTNANHKIYFLQGKKDDNSNTSRILAECKKKECVYSLFQVCMRVCQQQQKEQKEEKETIHKEI